MSTTPILSRFSRLGGCKKSNSGRSELPQCALAAGGLDPSQVASHPDPQALTGFLGLKVIPAIDRNLHPVHIAPETGLPLLLCSAAVYAVLRETDLRLLLRQAAQAVAEAMIGAVKALGLPEQDNATVTVLGTEADAGAGTPLPPADGKPTARRRPWRIIPH